MFDSAITTAAQALSQVRLESYALMTPAEQPATVDPRRRPLRNHRFRASQAA